jgi:signal peptidase I
MRIHVVDSLVQKTLATGVLAKRYPLSRKTPFSLVSKDPESIGLQPAEPSGYAERILQRSYTNSLPSRMHSSEVVRNCMLPSIRSGDKFLFEERRYLGGSLDPKYPGRFEVVCFWYPQNGQAFIKRLRGLPKETVEIKDGRILIDDTVLREPYPVLGMDALNDMAKALIPKRHVFLLADNRSKEGDSRDFGPLHISFVFGIVREILR